MSSVAPAEHARELFGGHLYRMISPEDEDFILSPAAVQKLLLAISLGTTKTLCDKILWDLYVKHVDEKRLREEANRAGIFDMGFSLEIRKKLELELSDLIEIGELLKYFKDDFNELGCDVTLGNSIVAKAGEVSVKEDYRKMLKEFFHTTLIRQNLTEEYQLLDPKCLNLLSDKNIDIFGTVDFKLSFAPPFKMLEDGSFETLGTFKHNEIPNCNSMDFRAEVLEVPLESHSNVELKMLIFIPNHFYTLLKQSIGRDYRHFDQISDKLQEKTVKVKLPKIKLEGKIELGEFLSETGHRGWRKFFNNSVAMDGMFENCDGMNFSIGNYWQFTSLEMFSTKSDYSVIALLYLFLAVLPCYVLSALPFISQVPDNVRQNFSLNLYRRLSTDAQPDFVVSPAALQKFLVVLYDGGKSDARLAILDDLCVNAVDASNFTQIAMAMMLQLTREEAHRKFFENDFKDTQNGFEIKNFIIGARAFDRSFRSVASFYFDVQTINRIGEREKFDSLREEFGEIVDENANLQLLNSIAFEAKLNDSFELRGGRLFGFGNFLYCNHNALRIIELPLESPNDQLILQIFLPDNLESLNGFIKQFGNEFDSMNKYNDRMSLNAVSVVLPEMRFEAVTDVGLYFKNYGTGVKRMLTENFGMEYAFEKSDEAVRIEKFWQVAKVRIKSSSTPNGDGAEKTLTEKSTEVEKNMPEETFDGTGKPFVFFIKSKDILYFVGTSNVS